MSYSESPVIACVLLDCLCILWAVGWADLGSGPEPRFELQLDFNIVSALMLLCAIRWSQEGRLRARLEKKCAGQYIYAFTCCIYTM